MGGSVLLQKLARSLLKGVDFFALLFCVLSASAFASVDKQSRLNTLLQKIAQEHDVPALSIGVIEKGDKFFLSGAGKTLENSPVTANTRFRVASISKLFTAVGVMQLVENGKLDLNDQVSSFIPAYQDKNITVMDLLTHHSSLLDTVEPSENRHNGIIEQYILASSRNQDAKTKQFLYADINFNLLGAIIEKVSGETFSDYVEKHISEPLGLTDTGFVHSSDPKRPQVEGYVNGWFLRKATQRPFDPAFAASEGLVTSVYDLLKWLKVLFAEDSSLLGGDILREMLTPKGATSRDDRMIGLGWKLSQNQYGEVVKHAGAFTGFKTLLISYPEIGRSIVILSNVDVLPKWDIVTDINQILDS